MSSCRNCSISNRTKGHVFDSAALWPLLGIRLRRRHLHQMIPDGIGLDDCCATHQGSMPSVVPRIEEFLLEAFLAEAVVVLHQKRQSGGLPPDNVVLSVSLAGIQERHGRTGQSSCPRSCTSRLRATHAWATRCRGRPIPAGSPSDTAPLHSAPARVPKVRTTPPDRSRACRRYSR
ncbi:hypothetical protein OH76DRAFT_1208017 [Lentinus brumalis]|uniref:Uncharacterized protein n=1 Tax=Lentinus brumalis TaxID=2498619 RepID=A0A371DL61_9APHY|nr:hypothetical protein OH76DRAFT_1208017 [Polyporus brumalis]